MFHRYLEVQIQQQARLQPESTITC